MSTWTARLVFAAALSMLTLAVAGLRAEIVRNTNAWECTDEGFRAFHERIASMHGRNLLARRPVLLVADGTPNDGRYRQLVDGHAGEYGAEGRVMINGTPTVLNFYLGEPKTITQVGAFTCNVDTRANQDFEVRFADSSDHPDEPPEFDKAPALTTGETILGADRGGFLTTFVDSAGGPLTPAKVDWIQFRIWRTYSVQAGYPAHSRDTVGASAYIELQVLGTEDDVVLPSPEELAHRERVRSAPDAPGFVQESTWHQSLIASYDAVLAWENLQDQLAMFESPYELGPWHVLGPIPADNEIVKDLRELQQVHLDVPVKDSAGQTWTWRKREDLTDGQLHNLSEQGGDNRKDILFLCREATFWHPVERRELEIAVSVDSGTGMILPQRQRLSIRSPAGLLRSRGEVKAKRGTHQLLLELRADRDNQRRFFFVARPGAVRPGAGDANRRQDRRRKLLEELKNAFPSPIDQAQIRWEDEDGIWGGQRKGNEDRWLPGFHEAYLRPKYKAARQKRVENISAELDSRDGMHGKAIAGMRDRLAAWVEAVRSASTSEWSLAELQQNYYQAAMIQEAVGLAGRPRSMQLSIQDQRETFGSRYPNAKSYQRRIDTLADQLDDLWQPLLAGRPEAMDQLLLFQERIDAAAQEILLANPLLQFDRLLLAEGGSSFASNWTGANRIGNRIVCLSPVGPNGQVTTIHSGTVSSMDLHWDGRRILFSDGKVLQEINADGTGLRQVTGDDGLLRYDPCYLPDGNLVFASNACQQAVPCTGGANVGNLHWIKPDGTGERRLTFDQDHNWNPTVMNDGRILYTRWEYTDAPHYFSRLLFRMNPDGTGQMEYYGSNSYWPNAMYWPRAIPGHPTMISCVVSGHHGVSRTGELVLLDPARGRHEAEGAVQKIPGYGQPVEAVMKDQLVTNVWPKFAAPYPLAEPQTDLGAGKYFLACVQQHARAPWQLCLVDIFDNITPIIEGNFMSPIPLRPRPMPPVIPSRFDPAKDEATVYLVDIYRGPGLKGFPRGSIKQLRIGTHHYRYFGNGDTRASSLEGGWDVKRILGTVPVNEDGSALFRVPANTPIFVQPLDAQGKAQQVMRSWFSAMPGEVVSCIGCHEKQNDVPPPEYSMAAMQRRPAAIKPWYGPVRGFSFEREVQPVLDRRCVGCHDGQPYRDGEREIATIDLRAKRLHDNIESVDPSAPKTRDSGSDYSPAYLALQQYVRRPGFESDYHMPKPAEYEADTSSLVQLLKKGHYNVQLTDEEWSRLYTWIDYNVPYPVNWRESHRPPTDEQIETRRRYKLLYAGIEDHDEDPIPLPPLAKFQPPAPLSPRPAPMQLAGWPLTGREAGDLQQGKLPVQQELDLGDGQKMTLVLVPAGRFVMGAVDGAANESPQTAVTIEQPFYMGQFEVTNTQFNCFDPNHDSGVINERWKDRSRRGTAINQSDAPVVRISWRQAMAFCRWLSERSDLRCTLPTEAQWEWAARAGTNTDFPVGDIHSVEQAFANIADESLRAWNHGRAERGYTDRLAFSVPGGRFSPNAWGLYDMHGNVAEWCRTTYRPYPHNNGNGRDNVDTDGAKVVRGGSWNDLLCDATSSARWRYDPYKPVYNVGFRIVLEIDSADQFAGTQ